MCSIVGYYKLNEASSHVANYIQNSFDLMRSRGPDNECYLGIDSVCALGHQRLSIIDMDNEANQPMKFNNFTIAFNGEVYNYIELRQELIDEGVEFDTHSDTEVLLKGYNKYGYSFLNKINGMSLCLMPYSKSP
jgi:asparagine synthase (glutamine-hydrolysing)